MKIKSTFARQRGFIILWAFHASIILDPGLSQGGHQDCLGNCISKAFLFDFRNANGWKKSFLNFSFNSNANLYENKFIQTLQKTIKTLLKPH